ncbi:MAG: hypothetical protein AAB579_02390 [Patescibacteria group bacterium]
MRISIFMVAMMAMMAGCFSWSRQTYDAQDGTELPKMQHSSWSVGVLPARSPMETASADAIGTDARTRAKYGYGGGYGTAGMAAAHGMFYYNRPYGVPANRVIFLENHSDYPVRVSLNGRVIPGDISPSLQAYLVSDHPTNHRLIFCAYETPGGVSLGQWQRYLGSNPGQIVHYRLKNDMFRGRCPF